MYTEKEIFDAFTDLIDEYQEFNISVTTEKITTVNKLNSERRECNIYHISDDFEKYVKSIKEIRAYNSLIDNLVYDRINVLISIDLNKLMTSLESENFMFGCSTLYENQLRSKLKLVEDVKFCLVRIPELLLSSISNTNMQVFNLRYSKLISKDYINSLILDSNLSDKDKLTIKDNLFQKDNI